MNLIFDLDDTIYNLMGPFQIAHEAVFADKTDVDCTEIFMRSRIVCDDILTKEKAGLIPPEECFYQRIKILYEEYGVVADRDSVTEFEKIYRSHQKKIHPFKTVAEILDFCKEKNINMAVLTNGREKNQRNKAASLEMNRWFPDERIFISGAIGHQKPEPGAFLYVQEQLQLDPKETWYIGDTYDFDIEGAHNAGWKTIWFNHRHRLCPDAESLADIEVGSSEELKTVIEELCQFT